VNDLLDLTICMRFVVPAVAKPTAQHQRLLAVPVHDTRWLLVSGSVRVYMSKTRGFTTKCQIGLQLYQLFHLAKNQSTSTPSWLLLGSGFVKGLVCPIYVLYLSHTCPSSMRIGYRIIGGLVSACVNPYLSLLSPRIF
jgi:hypothetical protein